MEKDYCNKCGKCCKNIAVDFEKKILFRDGVQTLTKEFADMMIKEENKGSTTLCSCRYLKDTLCTNPNKPVECQNFPSSPFAFLPENCGFEGDIFIKLEKLKQKVRKLKEEIIYYNTILPKDKSVQRIIDRHQAFIDKYKIYGSEDW